MSNTNVQFANLSSKNCWLDFRNAYSGGFGWRGDRPIDQIKYLVIHHTASTPTGNADSDIARIAREHIENRGWGGIGYNIVVTSEETNGYAKVAYTGDAGSIRAHTPNERGAFGIPKNYGNYYLMGISIVGNFVDTNPTDAQLRSIHEICYGLIFTDSRFKLLDSWDSVKNHKDFDYTSCAGNFENYKEKIQNPPANSQPMTFAEELKEAIVWRNLIREKYGIDLMTKVDASNVTRQELLVFLKRFTAYLQKSPNV